ncbi:uncharacterized protein ACNLHF_022788 [Anomaloglossus baeobatrachus]
MQRWSGVISFLGCLVLTAGIPQEDTVTNAIDNCNQELNTNFDLKFLDLPGKSPQNAGIFFKYTSYVKRRTPLLKRLFPWLYKPQTYQFVLTTAWKKPLTESRSPHLEQRHSGDMVIRTCSGFLTVREPIHYVLTCHNVTQEGTSREKSVETTAITTPEAEEGPGLEQDEELPGDHSWDLSRCLGCIFGMLNKPMRP